MTSLLEIVKAIFLVEHSLFHFNGHCKLSISQNSLIFNLL